MRITRLSHHEGRGLPITESMIQQTCTQMLEWDGWRALRTSPVSNKARGVGFGEPGMADHLYIRYIPRNQSHPPSNVPSGVAEVMWIEWKRLEKNGKPTQAAQHQKEWHTLERKRGALVLVAGEDFQASIEGFREWYKTSGLMRKRIIS